MPPLPFLRSATTPGLRAPPGFDQRRLLLERSSVRRYDAREWCEVLVVVERGVLELEWFEGARLCFEPGDTLCLSGLALRALRSAGPGPTVLLLLCRLARGSPPGMLQ